MAEKTRTTHARKWYEHTDGTRSRSAKPGWVALVFETVAPQKNAAGELVPTSAIRFGRGTFPSAILDCAAGHGLMQKLGDDLAGIEGKAAKDNASFDAARGYADYIAQRLGDMHNDLVAGVWVDEGEGGGGGGMSITLLLQAVLRTFSAAKVEVSDAKKLSLIEALKQSDYRTKMKARTDVSKHLADIHAERAEERRKAAGAAAKGAVESSIADLLPSDDEADYGPEAA